MASLTQPTQHDFQCRNLTTLAAFCYLDFSLDDLAKDCTDVSAALGAAFRVATLPFLELRPSGRVSIANALGLCICRFLLRHFLGRPSVNWLRESGPI